MAIVVYKGINYIDVVGDDQGFDVVEWAQSTRVVVQDRRMKEGRG